VSRSEDAGGKIHGEMMSGQSESLSFVACHEDFFQWHRTRAHETKVGNGEYKYIRRRTIPASELLWARARLFSPPSAERPVVAHAQ
jgi:hypothetical protein